jgi:hypothetical protein
MQDQPSCETADEGPDETGRSYEETEWVGDSALDHGNGHNRADEHSANHYGPANGHLTKGPVKKWAALWLRRFNWRDVSF